MDIVIVEDEILLGLLLADALTDVGHRVLGPASCRAEALGLVSDRTPHLALVDIELRDGESGIELAAELRRHGVACVFTTGQPVGARAHRGLELFGPDALPVSLGLLDTSAPAVVPCAGSGAPGAAPSAAAISASLPAQTEQRLGDAGVLEALTG